MRSGARRRWSGGATIGRAAGWDAAHEAVPMRHTRVIVTHYGGPDALAVVEEECPEPKDGEVRVRVLAAGVSLPDVLMREGVHPETPTLPFTPGWDLIGVVDKGRRRYLRNRTRPDSCRAADPRCLRGVR